MRRGSSYSYFKTVNTCCSNTYLNCGEPLWSAANTLELVRGLGEVVWVVKLTIGIDCSAVARYQRVALLFREALRHHHIIRRAWLRVEGLLAVATSEGELKLVSTEKII